MSVSVQHHQRASHGSHFRATGLQALGVDHDALLRPVFPAHPAPHAITPHATTT